MLKSIPSAKPKAPAKKGGNSGFRDFLKQQSRNNELKTRDVELVQMQKIIDIVSPSHKQDDVAIKVPETPK